MKIISDFQKIPFDELSVCSPESNGPVLDREMVSTIYDLVAEELSTFDMKIVSYGLINGKTGVKFLYGDGDASEKWPTFKSDELVNGLNYHLNVSYPNDRDNTITTEWGDYDINNTSNNHLIVTWNQTLNRAKDTKLKAK